MSILPPELEANYELLAGMHEGGMGAVYKARHRHLDELCVIKVMHASLNEVDGARERFFSEAKRGKQLRHPNIAEVQAFFVGTDGKAYLVMEYVDGENLRELLIRRGPLDTRTIVTIGVQSLAALSCLHSHNLVHRDISPDNLMLTAGATGAPLIKLIDLGIAKSLDQSMNLTGTGFVGKVSYAPPEQFRQNVDARTDIYSLGIVLYELATGMRPSRQVETMAIVGETMREEPPRPFEETDPHGRVPASLRAVILQAIQKKPEHRYQSADAFAQALERVLEVHSQTTTQPISVTEPATIPSAAPAAIPDSAHAPVRIVPRLTIAAALLLVLAGYGAMRMMRIPQPHEVPAPVTASVATSAVTVTTPPIVTIEQRKSAADDVARGKRLAAARKYQEAYAVFTAATKADPENAYAWANLGAAAALTSKRGEARAAYERALALDPANWLAHYNLACLLVADGKRDEAFTHLEATVAQLRLQAKSQKELDSVIDSMRTDEALGALRNDARFISLVGAN